MANLVALLFLRPLLNFRNGANSIAQHHYTILVFTLSISPSIDIAI